MPDLAALFAAQRRDETARPPVAADEMLVASTGPLRVAYPAEPSITYLCAVVGAAPAVGARVLVLHAGAAAHYCLGPIT